MLTAAQQKVKRELEELQTNALFHGDSEAVPPAEGHSLKKWVYLTIGFIGFMIISIFLTIELLTSNHERLTSYLSIEQNYYRQSEKLLNVSIEQSSTDMEKAKANHTLLIKRLNALETPSSLKAHKKELRDAMEQRLDILTYLTSVKNKDSLMLNKKLMELHIKEELAMDSLLEVLAQEKIKYVMKNDGTINYWVDDKKYTY